MTKEPDKSSWETNCNNESISGIEIRDKDGKLVHFITIKHEEVLLNKTPHRITIKLNEKLEPSLPTPQTFEEIIQAKRRQQQLLYGSHGTTSLPNTATISDRAARRVAAVARRQTSVSANSRRTIRSGLSSSSRRRIGGAGGGSSRRSSSNSRRKKPPSNQTNTAPQIPEKQESPQPSLPIVEENAEEAEEDAEIEPETEPIAGTSGNQLVTSLKDLNNKSNPLLKSVDAKEVKLLLKSALPGASIVLPNGTVIKKSRRGGARVGAGRKRSRPLPPGQSSRNHQASSNSSSFSSP